MEGYSSEKLLKGAEEEENVKLKDKIWNESKKMWVVAGPAIFTRFSAFGVSVISQAFVGHIGSTELAAYALVSTVLLRFANGIVLGMASGLETLCGQAYGAKQYHMLGIYLQRAWLVLFVTSTLLTPIFYFASSILKALGQDESIAEVAGIIGIWFIPAIYAFVISYSCQIYLQAQIKYKFGITGAMVSTLLAYWIPNAGQLIFVVSGGCPETWKGFSSLAFKDLWPIIKLSLSSGAMICLELWYNTILILLTGNLKNAEVAIDALSICININGWEMMIALGFLGAASVRVSNELGSGNSKAAKFSIIMTVLTSLAIGLVLFVFFLFFRGHLAYIFTKSQDVAKAVAHLSPLLAFSILLNSVQPVLSGVAIGAGQQSRVAYVNIGSYYIVGIPIGVVLGYVIKLQVEGVWIGMLIGTLVQTIILLILTFRTNWDDEVSVARRRVDRWFVEAETDTHLPSTV
ncbi:protein DETOXIFICATION 21-like isoform X2 [Olea europaea var. sylvestris]|uniref:protein DETOXIFICATION 21-like isoform X2 n=1 Tax=Olea europaea var. sylvestris TaxID=158386 RepID=UPI000C1D4A59|nr:protein DETOXIFICATION 21-like isoform X2 [Olea europaea var. sylvestris]